MDFFFFRVRVAHDVVLKINNNNAGAVYNNSINEVSKALEELKNCDGKTENNYKRMYTKVFS